MKLYNNINAERFESLRGILEEYAANFETLYKQSLEREGLNATNDLINSVTTTVKQGSDYYTVSFNAKEYWKFVENGRKAGKRPPINAIESWIEAKKILPRPDAKGNLPTQTQLAFMIARSIGEKGTIKRFGYRGSDVVAKTVEELNNQYLPLIEQALAEDFEHYAIEAFEGIVINKLGSIFTGTVNTKTIS